jgi:peptide/nickel transport system substrate-binding protein
MHRWLHIISWIILVGSLTGCGPIDPPPIMHPVQDSTTTPAGFTVTLASPLSCLAVGREATFDLTITNPRDEPRMLDPGPLEILVTGVSSDGAPVEHRWSTSTDYPPTVRRVFGAGEVRHYAWQWPVDGLGQMHVSVHLGLIDPQGATLLPPTHVELPVAIGSVPRIVGGYAGTIDVSCDEMLQSTEQTAISAVPTLAPLAAAAHPLPAHSATPTPARAERITIGMLEAPYDLIGISAGTFGAEQIMGILQPPCLNTLGYIPHAVCFASVPSIANGAIVTSAITVDATSQRVVVINDQIVTDPRTLTQPVTLEQVHVTWTIKDGVTWEDGVPVTAADFAFAARLGREDSLVLANGSSFVLERTESIEAVDPRTFTWHGLPGYRATAYLDTFFGPAPAHVLGSLSPVAITASPYASHPLAYGPYKLSEHIPNNHTTLVANEHYWAASAGLPKVGTVVVQYVAGTDQLVAGLASGAIDVASPVALTLNDVPALRDLEATGDVRGLYVPTDVWEHLDFGIARGDGDVSFFADVRVRRAVAYAIDRRAISAELMAGTTSIMRSFLPSDHWAYPPDHGDLNPYLYNPDTAAALLDAAGWLVGPDGIRTRDGRAFSVHLTTTDNPLRLAVARRIQTDLALVGIAVQLDVVPAVKRLFAPGPTGILAGRHFDLALYAWVSSADPPLDLYTCDQIPTAANGYTGQNNPGWCNAAYDQAALAAASSADQDTRRQRLVDAQTIFNADMPSLPLYQWVTIGAVRTDITGIALNPTSLIDFWNIETWERME